MQESRRETRLEVSAHVGTVTSCSSPPGAPTDRSHLSTPAVTRRSAALEDVGTGATEVVHKLDHNPTAPREAEEKGDDCGIEMLDMPPFLVKDINGVGSDAEQHCASPDPSTTKAPCFRRWIDFMRSSVVSVHYDHDVHARICVTNAFGAIVGVTEQMNEHHGKEMSMYGTRVRVVGPEGSDHINHSAEVLRINSEGENMTYTLCLDGGTYVNDTTTASAIITVRDSDTQMDADARESKNNPWTVSGGSGEYYMHGKTFRFSPTTELCQTTDSIPRNVIVWLITSRSFTRVVLVLILLNTAFIGLTDCSVVNESLEPAIYGRSTIPPYEELFSWRNALGIYSENVFTGLFAVEMLLKMVAMGVVLGKGSYLRNGWNWLDCTVVISGLVTALGLPGVAFMRSLRVLRPLKTLTAIPKMRLIVVALLKSTEELLNLGFVLAFVFIVFGILGLQSFSGVPNFRCRATAFPIAMSATDVFQYNIEVNRIVAEGIDPMSPTELSATEFPLVWDVLHVANRTRFPYCTEEGSEVPIAINSDAWLSQDASPWSTPRDCIWPLDPMLDRTCNDGTPARYAFSQDVYVCPSSGSHPRTCGSNFDDFGNPRFTDPTFMRSAVWNDARNWGFTSFDNIVFAFFTIFQCITLEGWTPILYILMDANGSITTSMVFIALILVGSFFLLNLTIAILGSKFEEVNEEERRAEIAKSDAAHYVHVRAVFHSLDADNSGSINGDELRLILPASMTEEEIRVFILKADADGSGEIEFDELAAALAELDLYEKHQRELHSGYMMRFMKNVARWWYRPADISWLRKIPCCRAMYAFVEGRIFGGIIVFCILLNTVTLSLDMYPERPTLALVLEIINFVLSTVFAIELFIKLPTLGFRTYVKDPFNVFDAFVVAASVVDVIVAPPAFFGRGVTEGGGSAVTAVRTVRVFRLFKLAKAWKSLQELLLSIAKSLQSAVYFVVLMLLFIFIFAIIGMQNFANVLYFDSLSNDAIALKDVQAMYAADNSTIYRPTWYRPRSNFDSFIHAVFVVFQILSLEDWNVVMYNCVRAQGSMSRVYFIAVVALGSMVLLNFFLAILLSDFEEAAAGGSESEEELDAALRLIESTNDPGAFGLSTSAFAALVAAEGRSSVLCADAESGNEVAAEAFAVVRMSAANMEKESLKDQLTCCTKLVQALSTAYRWVVCTGRNEENLAREAALNADAGLGTTAIDLSVLNDDVESEDVATVTDNVVVTDKASIGNLTAVHNKHHIQDDPTTKVIGQWVYSVADEEKEEDIEEQGAPKVSRSWKTYLKNVGRRTHRDDSLWLWRNELQDARTPDMARGPVSAATIGRFIQKWTAGEVGHLRVREVTQVHSRTGTKCFPHTPWLSFSDSRLSGKPQHAVTIGEERKLTCQEEMQARARVLFCTRANIPHLPARSLFLFRYDFKPREWTAHVVLSKRFAPLTFDNCVLVLIIISSIALAMETPLDNPSSGFTISMRVFNLVINVIFTLEMMVKIFVHGFVMHHGAYMADKWNQLDAGIVIISWLTFILSDVSVFKTLRTLRLLRLLRALRTINRFPGLKLVVEALLRSIPPLLNLIPVIGLFFMIFAIFSVSSLKGALSACSGSAYDGLTDGQQLLIRTPVPWSSLPSEHRLLWPVYPGAAYTESISNVTNATVLLARAAALNTPAYIDVTSKAVCEWLGAEWTRVVPQSFDNVLSAMSSFLQMSTTEGWVDVAFAAVDNQGIDMQPTFENEGTLQELGWLSFFSAFIAFGGFFLVNLFIGVMIQTFKRMQRDQGGGAVLLTPAQEQWAKTKKALQKLRPNERYREPKLCRPLRIACFHIATSEIKIPLAKVDCRKLQVVQMLMKSRNRELEPLFFTISMDLFIMVCIMGNTMSMGIQFFGQPGWYTLAIAIANYIFATIFTIEAALKLIGLGFSQYWRNDWNKFDLLVVIGTITSISMTAFFKISIGGLAMIVRTFRLARIVRLLNKAKTLRMIFNAVILSGPALVNVGSLCALIFFIFTCISVQLFAKVSFVDDGELNEQVNFINFPNALLTLLRSSTGEAWPNMLYELADQPIGCVPDPEYDQQYCRFSSPPFKEGCIPLEGCGTPLSVLFWPIFILFVSCVMLNLIVFYILDAFETTKNDEEKHLNYEQEQELLRVWGKHCMDDGLNIAQSDLVLFFKDLRRPMGFAPNKRSSDVRHHEGTSPERMDDQFQSMQIKGHNLDGKTVFGLIRVAVAVGKRVAADKQEEQDEALLDLPEDHALAGDLDEVSSTDGEAEAVDLKDAVGINRILRLYRVYRTRHALMTLPEQAASADCDAAGDTTPKPLLSIPWPEPTKAFFAAQSGLNEVNGSPRQHANSLYEPAAMESFSPFNAMMSASPREWEGTTTTSYDDVPDFGAVGDVAQFPENPIVTTRDALVACDRASASSESTEPEADDTVLAREPTVIIAATS